MKEIDSTQLVLVGGTGYIGKKIASAVPGAVVTSSRRGAGVAHLDLCEVESWHSHRFGADTVVVLLAAESSPDVCGRDRARAEQINVRGALDFIRFVTDLGARVVGFSSDVVLGDLSVEMDESAPLKPVGPYAEMKAKLEEACKFNRSVRLARLSYVCSTEDRFSKYLLNCVAEQRAAQIFDPFQRRVVAAQDVVEGILAWIRQWDAFQQPVMNFAGPNLLSREDLAREWMKGTGKIVKLEQVDPPPGFFDLRPHVINMVSHSFERLLGRALTSASQSYGAES